MRVCSLGAARLPPGPPGPHPGRACPRHRPGEQRQSDRESASEPPVEGTRGSGAGFLTLRERLCSTGPTARPQGSGLRAPVRPPGGQPAAEAEELLGIHVHFTGHTRRWARRSLGCANLSGLVKEHGSISAETNVQAATVVPTASESYEGDGEL